MKSKLIDTNIIIHYFIEDPEKVSDKFKGVFTFFPKVEIGEITIDVPDLVIFEAFFVLTKVYAISYKDAAKSLHDLVSFKGFLMRDKDIVLACLKTQQSKKIDFVDAYISAYAKQNKITAVYSFNSDIKKLGLDLLEVK